MATYTRRNIWELETEDPDDVWDPYTLAYAKAVVEMRARSVQNPDDPTGWTFQAAMHGTYAPVPPGALCARRPARTSCSRLRSGAGGTSWRGAG